MRVAELLVVLAHVPAELNVHVRGGYVGSFHVDRVERARRRRINDWYIAEPSLIIEGRKVLWHDEPPAFDLRGPFRDEHELDARLDALDAFGAPR